MKSSAVRRGQTVTLGGQNNSPQTHDSTLESQLLRPGLSSPLTHKGEGHFFDDENVHLLDRDTWFERGIKEAIYVKLEKPTFNKGGGLRYQLSATYIMQF